jgi:ribosomal protein S18 acetylase RimI-like enzyme
VTPAASTHPVVRTAVAADLDALAGLFDSYRQFYGQAPDFAQARAFLHERMTRQESVLLVAAGPVGGLIGFCQLYPTFCSVEAAPIHSLYDLFVSPEARGRGAARLLLTAARAHAEREGKVRLDLTTAKTNYPAQALYESLGWQRDEVFSAYSLRLRQ